MRKYEMILREWQISSTISAFAYTKYEPAAKVVHVLDMSQPDSEYRSVTNGIDDIQPDIAERYGVDIDSVTWLLYGTDCIVSEFKRGRFVPAKKDMLDEECVKLMAETHTKLY